ncbi:flagellar export chaperone FlgN [Wukongibacter baidiensis]|uniref:flagellar export chaperone FlgN n=1 Tax=Wukongibacter baidiensis TaxID=1723361 RepID=UPI003D7FBEB2
MIERIENKRIDSLIEILNIKLELLQGIYDLTCDQAQKLKDENIDGYIKILDRKEIRIKKIKELDEKYNDGLEKIKESYNTEDLNDIQGSEKVVDLKQNIQKVLKNIYDVDKSNSEKFNLEFEKVRSKMVDFKKGKKVTSNYYKVPTQVGGYFIDNKR